MWSEYDIMYMGQGELNPCTRKEKMMENTNLQFYVRKTDKNLIEIVEVFEKLDKVRIGFRNFSLNEEKGSRVSASVDFYMTIPELDLLCHNLLSGNIVKTINAGGSVPPMYKGSKRGDEIFSRTLSFAKSNKGLFFTACEGPGKMNNTGAVMPLYNMNDAPSKVSIPLNNEEIKAFAIQGKRACDYYYANYFGKK